MRHVLIWSISGVFIVALTILAVLPASVLVQALENQTGGRITLGDPQGSVWQGSAFVGAAMDSHSAVSPMLPGRFSWQLSPLVLLGRVDAVVQNSEALSAPLSITGDWRHWRLGASSLLLPAERLAALGAPLNTVRPSGLMRLSWEELQIAGDKNGVAIDGRMQLYLTDIASALSPVKPLGAYRLQFDWHEDTARLTLATTSGPLMLTGSGTISNGHLQFSGQASAQEGQEERLAVLLSLLGRRRQVDNKNIIALEFK